MFLVDLNDTEKNTFRDLSNDSIKVLSLSFNSPEVVSEDFFVDIDYLPLETTTESMFANIDQLISLNQGYLILDKKTKYILFFDRNGKFKFRIDKIGGGPSEYKIPKAISYNRFLNCVEVLDNTRHIIQRYSMNDGSYLSTVPVGFGIKTFEAFASDHYVLVVDSYQFNENRYALVKDLERQVLIAKVDQEEVKIVSQHVEYVPNTGSLNFSTKQNIRPGTGQELLVNVTFNDTIYSLTETGLVAKYKIDFGEWAADSDVFEKFSFPKLKKLHDEGHLPSIAYFWELDEYLYAYSGYEGKINSCFFSKSSQKKVCVQESDYLQSAGAFAGWPLSATGNKLVYVMEPEEVFSMKKTVLSRINQLYPDATDSQVATIIDTFYVQREKYDFLKLTEGAITEDSNPVLVFTRPNFDLR